MEITLDGTKHTIPDDSTHLAVDSGGGLCAYYTKPELGDRFNVWVAEAGYKFLVMLDPPKDFTKCLAEVSDGAVISFEGK